MANLSTIENNLDWRHFGKRYLTSSDFIRLCNLVGLYLCNEHELEEYEKRGIMYPVARTIMPDDYGKVFWLSQLQGDGSFEFDEKYLPYHNLDWAIRYQLDLPTDNEQDWRHPIDKAWGIVEGLRKPIDEDFVPWSSSNMTISVGGRKISKSTASHFYHYWQVYELYDVRKYQIGMYKDNHRIPRFGGPDYRLPDGLPYFLEALSYFYTIYSGYYSWFFKNLQPNSG